MRTLLRLAVLLSVPLAFVAIPSTVLAEALVVVQVQTEDGAPVDGEVTLTRRGGDGATFSCTTEDGECQIPHVPGGRYTVHFDPSEGESPADKTAMIPPSGRVTLHVAAR